jgi:hypothetical protein
MAQADCFREPGAACYANYPSTTIRKIMISEKIQALFDFIDYLDTNKAEFIEKYIPLCDELTNLDIQRSKLKPKNNYIDKQRYDEIQKGIEEKFQPITQNIYIPVLDKMKELGIWSGDNVFTSIWNNNMSAIYDLRENFTSDDIIKIKIYKQKYLSFRTETNSNFLCLQIVLSNLDDILKELFDFFKDNNENEFESFETKTIAVNNFEAAIKGLVENKGKNVKFSLPQESLYNFQDERQVQVPLHNIKNEIIMGDKFENIHHSTIYNRSTFKEAFNSVKTNYSEECAQALEIVKSLIEKSGNEEAGELFDSFNEEIKKETPKKSVLTSLWDGLIKIVPMITQTAGLVDKIMRLIHH